MQALTATEAKQFLRLAKLSEQFDYIARKGQAMPGAQFLSAVTNTGSESRMNPVLQLLGNSQRVNVTPFSLIDLRLGQGGEAFLQQLEKHTAAVINVIEEKGPQAMGIWSFNPAKWGLSPAEADAYDIAQAKKAAEIKAINPGILDTISTGVKDSTKAAAGVSSTLMWVGGGVVALWAISEILSARGASWTEGAMRAKAAASKRY